ncbi:hypothetical protein HMPREF9080_02010 [Cardiobacterium valvarum F0432]|uniref:Uncharacterized protein n=1 Tax=Cardiobacterium valvarum F0432 TaxID=797473 RepID=G9ZGP6_9GAMM|nr:hypothetical protein HMPREF9080_02010 [Cardiobacterium valvarum F0432]
MKNAASPGIYPAWHAAQSRILHGKNLFPHLRGKVAAGRKGEYKTRIYPA